MYNLKSFKSSIFREGKKIGNKIAGKIVKWGEMVAFEMEKISDQIQDTFFSSTARGSDT